MAIEGLPSTGGSYMPDLNNLPSQVGTGQAAKDVTGVVELDAATESQSSAGLLSSLNQLSQLIDKFDDYPVHVYNPAQLESMTASLQNLGSLGTDQMGTDTLAFLKIFQEMAKEMKAAAREMRTAELTAQISALNSAADQMKVAADARLAAGIVQSVAGMAAGAMQVAGGVAQIGASVGSAGSALKSAKLEQQAGNAGLAADVYQGKGDMGSMKINKEIAIDISAQAKIEGSNAASWGAVGQAAGQIGGGLSGITNSIGGLGASIATRIADAADEAKTRLETDAKVHETAVQHTNDLMQQMQQLIDDVKEKLAAMLQASVETTRGIARNV